MIKILGCKRPGGAIYFICNSSSQWSEDRNASGLSHEQYFGHLAIGHSDFGLRRCTASKISLCHCKTLAPYIGG
jgi:hypothetical protein